MNNPIDESTHWLEPNLVTGWIWAIQLFWLRRPTTCADVLACVVDAIWH